MVCAFSGHLLPLQERGGGDATHQCIGGNNVIDLIFVECLACAMLTMEQNIVECSQMKMTYVINVLYCKVIVCRSVLIEIKIIFVS